VAKVTANADTNTIANFDMTGSVGAQQERAAG
jgi:hypothetical protein